VSTGTSVAERRAAARRGSLMTFRLLAALSFFGRQKVELEVLVRMDELLRASADNMLRL
jgi:hypothetical protein